MRLSFFCLTASLLLTGCLSSPFFTTPNYLGNINGKLYLMDGSSVEGELSISTTNTFGSPVKVKRVGEKDALKYNLEQVLGYELRGDYYALKEIRSDISSTSSYVKYSFMRRLTPANSAMHLYEDLNSTTYTSKNANGTSTSNTSTEKLYYAQLPHEGGRTVFALDGRMFVPYFDQKVSGYVSDCPTLAQRIINKEDHYFYPEFSINNTQERRLEVMMNIASQYNNCK